MIVFGYRDNTGGLVHHKVTTFRHANNRAFNGHSLIRGNLLRRVGDYFIINSHFAIFDDAFSVGA